MGRQRNTKEIRKVREHGTGIEPVLTPYQRQAEKLYLNDKKCGMKSKLAVIELMEHYHLGQKAIEKIIYKIN